jgi:peroxiredoxin Q/BCP
MKRFFLISLIIMGWMANISAQAILGEKVPNFKTTNQDGEKWVLKKTLKESDYLVLYFYPAAFTGGCTKQACSYRDQKGELAKVGATVAGVSGDAPETLQLFAMENSLNFNMLADETGSVASIFGVPQNEGGSITREIKGKELNLTRGTTIQRWTFILDREGTLIYKDAEVDAANDSGKVLEFLSSLL